MASIKHEAQDQAIAVLASTTSSATSATSTSTSTSPTSPTQSKNLHKNPSSIHKSTLQYSPSTSHTQKLHPSSSDSDLEGSASATASATMTNVVDEFAALSLTDPYGCTYLCGQTFTTSSAWRKHEISTHRQEELWRCPITTTITVTIPSSTPPTTTTSLQCGACFFSARNMAAHLTSEHADAVAVSSDDDVDGWVDAAHLHGEGQGNFWCGFCRAIVALEERGMEAWDERLGHVEEHFQNGDSVAKGWLKLRR